ncbi:MAG: methionine adenosyltransferase [Blastochloris viridis]|uniref:S-adenosylmethionine synthase n=1 Tax=Blastochloris viridis TaxID=1079 RepID=A0A6N4RAI3_BLAVI|nr:MAG: methionine adenosyltransferase [Blastochloris viridis]
MKKNPPAGSHLFTSEAVSCGHPDKLADQLSDAILDAYLAQDPEARVASEILVTTDFACLGGEFRTHAKVDVDTVVRKTIETIGYAKNVNEGFDAATVKILNKMHEQSPEIAQGVDAGARASEGAGDQGLMFGFACDETPELMPAPIHYAHAVLRELEAVRRAGKKGEGALLLPDAKSQITVEYVDDRPVRAHTLLISHQHTAEARQDELKALITKAWQKVLPDGWMDDETRILVNPTGSFNLGGPAGDTGLTGRKIIVDTYGGYARHGGGAFSGKDPTKVDRSAAYAARYVAKNIVAAGLARKCEIQLGYAIGIAEPLSIYVETFGTSAYSSAALEHAVRRSMSLTPRGIRMHLGLNAPIYLPTASGGHFGRAAGSAGEGTFPWEATTLADTLKANIR